MEILVVLGVEDDNKGDAAISIATVQQLRERFPTSNLTLMPLSATQNLGSHFKYSKKRFDHVVPSLWGSAPASGEHGEQMRGWVMYTFQLLRAVLLVTLPVLLRVKWLFSSSERESASALRRAGLVVARGGSVIYSYRGARGRMYMLRALFPLALAHRLGKRTIVLGQSLSEEHHPVLRWALVRQLVGCDLILLRDSRSIRLASRLGVPPRKLHLIPDLAFTLRARPSTDVAMILVEVRRKAGAGPVLFLSIRRMPENRIPIMESERYLRSVRDAVVEFISERGGAVLLVPQSVGPYILEDDRALLIALASQLEARGVPVHLPTEDLDPEALIALYAGTDLGIATRLHAGVLSLIGGTPCVVTTYLTSKAHTISDWISSDWAPVVPLNVSAPDLVTLLSRLFTHASAANREAIHQQALATAGAVRTSLSLALGNCPIN